MGDYDGLRHNLERAMGVLFVLQTVLYAVSLVL